MSESTARDRVRMLEGVYVAEHPRLVRFLRRMTRCPHRAEDLAQATWLKLLPKVEAGEWQSRSDADLRSCLYTAARHLYLDEYTRKHGEARTRTVDPDELAGRQDDAADPAVQVDEDRVRRQIRGALSALPGEQRHVVLMWLNDTPVRTMAALTSAPVDTVLSRKKYAFARLRRLLEPVLPADAVAV
jgi:RNA polymerase sigma factor (sigma-70 family)